MAIDSIDDLPLSDEDREALEAGGIAMEAVPATAQRDADVLRRALSPAALEDLSQIVDDINDAVTIGIGVARDALKEYLDSNDENASPTLQLIRAALVEQPTTL